jgi:hypothetical protein
MTLYPEGFDLTTHSSNLLKLRRSAMASYTTFKTFLYPGGFDLATHNFNLRNRRNCFIKLTPGFAVITTVFNVFGRR